MTPSERVLAAQLALRSVAGGAATATLLDEILQVPKPDSLLERVCGSRSGLPLTAASGLETLRREYAAELGLSAADLEFRALFPGLDLGVYACSHSMGVPSIVGPAAVAEHYRQLSQHGIGVWDEGTWPRVMDQFAERCAALVGGNLAHGDVTWFPNVSESLAAALDCIEGGTLVYTAGHFTTGHYIHHQWAKNTGGKLVEIPTDADGSVPTQRILDALTRDVRVLSISHVLFESGWLQDLPALAAGLRERCPDAILLLDAYQTAGTVPIDVAVLGDHVIVTAAGHKQLRSGTGAGFLYVPRRLLEMLQPKRTGWWNHAEPFAFEKGAVRRANDGSKFRTGTPTVAGMAMLLGELAALASATGGDLGAAVVRARRVTSGLVDVLLAECGRHGLAVRGNWPSERRGAFVCIEVDEGPRINEALAELGFRVDFRPRQGGAGWLRVSGNCAGFAYEMQGVVTAIAAAR